MDGCGWNSSAGMDAVKDPLVPKLQLGNLFTRMTDANATECSCSLLADGLARRYHGVAVIMVWLVILKEDVHNFRAEGTVLCQPKGGVT